MVRLLPMGVLVGLMMTTAGPVVRAETGPVPFDSTAARVLAARRTFGRADAAPRSVGTPDRLGIAPLPLERPAAQDTIVVRRRHKTTSLAVLLVGATALVTGLLTDEEAATVIGAGITGVGIYLYFR